MPDIDSLSDRALDAAVAEKVMEWRIMPEHSYVTPGGSIRKVIPAFSRDWSAAALAVERMREMGYVLRCYYTRSGWTVVFENRELEVCAVASADTFPTAVCRAALKAREGK